MNNKLEIPSWDELFLRKVYLMARKSKDPRTQIGAVLVKDKADFASGYNGISPMVREDIPSRHERPEKYFWYEHGERNSIYFCAFRGISTCGATMYTNGTPCADCGRAIIRAGIVEVVVHKQWELNLSSPKWTESCERTRQMFNEAKVNVRTVDLFLNVQILLNGDIITV